MIILDEEPSSKLSSFSSVAGPTLRHPERAAGRSTSHLTLPDYETSQAIANNDLVYKKVVKKRIDARFWWATLYALIIYIVLSLLIGIPIVVTKLKQRSYRKYSQPPPGPPWQAGIEVSGPNCSMTLDDLNGAPQICNSWTSSQDQSGNSFVASSQYKVSPLGQFSIRSNVSGDSNNPHFITGHLTIGMNPDKTAKDALLSVGMQASSPTLRKDTNVCLTMNDNACDLALYVPDKLSGSDSLQFNISLLFPFTTNPSTVDILATWLPMFTQSFAHMDDQWTFSKITIEGPLSKFEAGYLQANNLLVQTSLAEIKGTFQVNESLTLDTVDAPINATIRLLNDWERKTPTHLTLDTGNGAIDAKIHLVAPRPTNRYATFLTSMKTFNAQLKASVTHDESTPPSEFHLHATNYLAETYITLDPKYVGTFDLQTKLATASVKEGDENAVVDPSGGGGKRGYQFDLLSSTRIFGWVGWGSRPGPTTKQTHQGYVEIVSSHSSVSLQLEGAGNRVGGQS
jgi:hypothetical protein